MRGFLVAPPVSGVPPYNLVKAMTVEACADLRTTFEGLTEDQASRARLGVLGAEISEGAGRYLISAV